MIREVIERIRHRIACWVGNRRLDWWHLKRSVAFGRCGRVRPPRYFICGCGRFRPLDRDGLCRRCELPF